LVDSCQVQITAISVELDHRYKLLVPTHNSHLLDYFVSWFAHRWFRVDRLLFEILVVFLALETRQILSVNSLMTVLIETREV